MKQLLKWEKELVMLLLPDNKSGVMSFSGKIYILKRDSCTIILYNRQYSKRLQLCAVRGTVPAEANPELAEGSEGGLKMSECVSENVYFLIGV
jgi:hypothetical protein